MGTGNRVTRHLPFGFGETCARRKSSPALLAPSPFPETTLAPLAGSPTGRLPATPAGTPAAPAGATLPLYNRRERAVRSTHNEAPSFRTCPVPPRTTPAKHSTQRR